MIRLIHLALLVLTTNSYAQTPVTPTCASTRNAVFDIGSGNTKLRVADVDCHGRVTLVLQERSRVAYMTAINASADQSINETIILEGIAALVDLKQKANLLTPPPERLVGIATAAFRMASNGSVVARRLATETQIKISIITQEEEGKIGYLAALTQAGTRPDQTVVWDVGGGSMQLGFTQSPTVQMEAIEIARAQYGADIFKDEVITLLQNRELVADASPNPLNAPTMARAIRHAQRRAHEQFGAQSGIKRKIRRLRGSVVGIGGLFGKSVRNQILGTPELAHTMSQNILTDRVLAQMVRRRIGMDDTALRAVLDDGFHRTHATHFALLSGFMKELGIKEVKILETETGDGLFSLIKPESDGHFTFGQYWQ